MTRIAVTVNGDPREVDADLSLAGLLETLGLRRDAVVVEHNRRIVRRAELDTHGLADGDTIEIVHFVGGG
ncbi:MAG: sulfur carrier protein ThiS [Gemmatimonadales bacterium]|jgi:thiazole synthase|nr:sulfur carrier protein ThiS [Gemmatimonadales bacterium]